MSAPATVSLACVDTAGRTHRLCAPAGVSVMEALRAADLLVGECGGSLACATCHVWVDPGFAARFAAPSEGEEEMLDVAFNLSATSRLSCQLVLSRDVDGLVVALPRAAG